MLHLHHRRPLNWGGGEAGRQSGLLATPAAATTALPLLGSPFPALTLDFAEGAHAQRVPQDVVPDLHPPVLMFLFIRRRHLAPKTEPAHQRRAWTVPPPARVM